LPTVFQIARFGARRGVFIGQFLQFEAGALSGQHDVELFGVKAGAVQSHRFTLCCPPAARQAQT
jgi:hypothetical protein